MKRISWFKSAAGGRALIVCALGILFTSLAQATPPVIVAPDLESGNTNATGTAGFLTELRRSNYLLEDMWGLRPWLSKYGMSLSILETSEALGNVSGGVKHGLDYDGLTQMVLQLDTQRAFHLYGGLFNVSGLQIHGRSESADYLDTLQTASGI